MDNLIGKRLDGRYSIESLVGVGGMANVYRGTDLKTGNQIAVKVLKDEFLDNEELVRRFKNESKAISILSHPNIVKVYDVSVTDKLQYIVMEYVDGITLKEYLKQRGGALTWKETVHFATQILSALQHAHSKGIIHRDVKPQNIMLLADGSIKMMDFGIARFSRAQSQTVSDKAIGSVHYISPERTDARTDIYSVGVMLYEMLSGRLPFDGDGAVSIAIMQISEKPKPLAEIAPQTPAGLRQITEKAMEKDPDKRYQSAQEMLAAIEEFKRNPSIQFAYEYRSAEDNPERNINRVVSNTKPSPKSTSIHTGDARRVGTSNPGRSKSAQKKKKKASKGFSLLPIFFGMAVAFVIGAAILIYLIFTNSSNLLFSNRADVQVISFVGMTKDEFLATDYNNLLRAEFPEEYSSEPAGTIIRQTPKAGRTVKEKQRIVLTVSLGTQYVTIPETKNMVAEDAEQTLKDMGLRVTKKPMSDNSVANGAVVYTQPAAGETVEGDSTVILYVSRSEVSKESQVPSLTGKTIEEARNEVKGLNLSIRTIEQASEQPAGTVLSQSPDAGSTVRKSSVITLVVSTGVPEVVATPEPVEPTVNEDGSITVQESWWPSADGSHQIHQLTDGTMWNENGQRCDAQGNPIA